MEILAKLPWDKTNYFLCFIKEEKTIEKSAGWNDNYLIGEREGLTLQYLGSGKNISHCSPEFLGSAKPQAYFDNWLFSPFMHEPVFERKSEPCFSLVYTQLINMLGFLRVCWYSGTFLRASLYKSSSGPGVGVGLPSQLPSQLGYERCQFQLKTLETVQGETHWIFLPAAPLNAGKWG